MKINAPQYPMQTSFEHQSPSNPKDCFRIVNPKIYSRIGLKQGELLQDAKYIHLDNESGRMVEIDGLVLQASFNVMYGTTYIPWVLARCTIIPI